MRTLRKTHPIAGQIGQPKRAYQNVFGEATVYAGQQRGFLAVLRWARNTATEGPMHTHKLAREQSYTEWGGGNGRSQRELVKSRS